jgi:hypothetical protein
VKKSYTGQAMARTLSVNGNGHNNGRETGERKGA